MRGLMIYILSACTALACAQNKTYAPGDIIDIAGVKAIVYQTDDSGRHGTAMSVECLRGVKNMWCTDKNAADALPPTTDEHNGEANTKTVTDFARSQGILDRFPVYEWCERLGQGWYVPSLKELEAFVNFWLGNEQTIDWDTEEETEYALDNSKPYYKQVNVKMLDAGGIPFLNGVFTSTVNEDGKVYVFWFNAKKNSWMFHKSSKDRLSKYFVGRAFHKF